MCSEGQCLGEHGSAESRFSQRASRWRIEARRDLEATHGSSWGGRAGKMDRAASPPIQRPHPGNHAGNRLRVGTAQRVASDSTGRWFARSDRTGSSANVRDAQYKKRGRVRHLARESVDMTSGVLGPDATLRRGYSITMNERGKIIRTIAEVRPKMEIRTRVSDGEFGSEVL